ncbi:hypothetical protein Q2T40_15680 [Winogradskyella maritima]|uniref:Type II toxin-antitoxin system RelE/ParE family toxin n=1 Tax=Winogradskyella maritima TaxID=1517766 RepID=A0ABV8AFM5_9FLAO|nr:hypothetical protein [Winogradskyella maritima]
MDVNYSISDEAQRELYKASCYFKYIEKEDAFFEDLMNQLRLIQRMPYSFQIRYRDVRIVQLEYFAYTIHYRVFDDGIYIVRLLQQSQDF